MKFLIITVMFCVNLKLEPNKGALTDTKFYTAMGCGVRNIFPKAEQIKSIKKNIHVSYSETTGDNGCEFELWEEAPGGPFSTYKAFGYCSELVNKANGSNP